jgi:hypothetical protein
MRTSIIQYIVITILFSSYLYTASLSRLVTTIDPSSTYDFISIDQLSNEVTKQSIKNSSSINIAYEQLLYNTDNINLYAGGEFMFGRKAESRIAFHSLYLMPSYELLEKLSLSARLGLAQLNTDQDSFPINFGFVSSIGLEYQISSKIALSLSYTAYEMKNEIVRGSTNYSTPFSGDIIAVNDLELDLKYNKFGISVVYGFEIADKKERNEKN